MAGLFGQLPAVLAGHRGEQTAYVVPHASAELDSAEAVPDGQEEASHCAAACSVITLGGCPAAAATCGVVARSRGGLRETAPARPKSRYTPATRRKTKSDNEICWSTSQLLLTDGAPRSSPSGGQGCVGGRAGHGHAQVLASTTENPLLSRPHHQHREGRPRPSPRISVRLQKAQSLDATDELKSTGATAYTCDSRASWNSSWLQQPLSYREALPSCAHHRKITRPGSLFDPHVP